MHRAEATRQASTSVAAPKRCEPRYDGLFPADNDHEPLAAGNASVEEIWLQHGIVLGQDLNDHGGILRASWLLRMVAAQAGTKVSSSPKP